ncbi:amidase [Acuticoccus sediminis]|nr:amidase [Acuticoccus sediminis]
MGAVDRASADPAMLDPRLRLERRLERIAARERHVRAFVCHDADAARRMAEASGTRLAAGRALSALDGAVLGVKDVFETADSPTTCGSPILAGFEARRDAAAVAALRRAGAVVLGKTVTTEFAVGAAGPTRNPVALERSPGGSSSGSAAAVADGMVDMALGTQTQSSTLRPASYCGIVGFKPSFGAAPMGGAHPLAPSMDTMGLLAPDVTTAWTLLRVLCGEAWPEPLEAVRPVRVALLKTAGWAHADPGVLDAFARAVRAIEAAGVAVVDGMVGGREAHDAAALAALETELADADTVSEDILAYEMEWPFRAYDEAHPGMLGHRVKALVDLGRAIDPDHHRANLVRRERMRARLTALGGNVDAVLTLASPTPAPLGSEAEGPPPGARSFCVPATLMGAPALSLPVLSLPVPSVGEAPPAALPVGLQVIAPPGRDRHLAAVGRWLERHLSPAS